MMTLGLIVVLAAGLPTFEDFREADKERRESGQFQTARAGELTRMDAGSIEALAAKRRSDALTQWGAAELLTNWAKRKAHYEAALHAGDTNLVVALRYGCAAAQNGDEAAGRWLRYCAQRDPSNAVPWIAEAWLQWKGGKPVTTVTLPATAIQFRDGGVEAGLARIRLLEALGYSPYSARRIGYLSDGAALGMIRDLGATRWVGLRDVALAMQQGARFIVTELVGQSVESHWLREEDSAAAKDRRAAVQARRDELQRLVAEVGATTVLTAREHELVEYFDRLLTDGETAALNWLKKLDEP